MRKHTVNHFAENLRRECLRFGSIAKVCRGIGLNRQQFNKYLRGDNIPHARTRRKICEYLNIPEDELFYPPQMIGVKVTNRVFQPSLWHRNEINAARETLNLIWPATTQSSVSTFKPGIYFCYFPLQGYQNMLVRSVLKIAVKDGLTTFVRHTFFRLSRQRVGFISQGRHYGIVVTTPTESYLLGINSAHPHHLSLLAFPHSEDQVGLDIPGERDVMRGLALTRGLSQPYSCCVCLEFLGNKPMQLKEKLSTTGVVSFADCSINPSVLALLETEGANIPGQLDLPVFEHLVASVSLLGFTNGRQHRHPSA